MCFIPWLFQHALAEPANMTSNPTTDSSARSPIDKLPVLIRDAVLHYPESALAEELHGTVEVRVRIAENGAVVQTSIVSGLDVFHDEAQTAARRLLFEPALRNGTPVSVDMIVSFHFAPPHPEPRGDLEHADHSIVVSAHDLHEQSLKSSSVMNEQEVHQNRQFDISRTIADVPGVTFASGSSNNSKPIIRGQTERRLMVMKDGVAHAGQKWGMDHAPEIDPFSIGSIEVRKGVDAVRFGGDAIGGVLLIDSPTLSPTEGFTGQSLSVARSNGRQIGQSVRQDFRQEQHAIRVYGNFLSSADLSTPKYVLGNTASQLWNAGLTGDFEHPSGRFWWSMDHFHNAAGVFYGLQSSSPDELRNSVLFSQPPNADSWSSSREWSEPYQNVEHTRGVTRWHQATSWGDLELQYAFQRNHRQEKDASRNVDDVDPQYNFTLLTHNLDLHARHDGRLLGSAEMDLEWGLNGKIQDNLYDGLSLLPNYRQFDLGGYALSKIILSTAAIQTGIRWDGSMQDAYLSDNDYVRHERLDLLPEDCVDDGVKHCSTEYQTASFVLGGIWQIIPETLEWRGDVSTGGRFPNVDERYLLGAAPSFPVYAMGDPNIPKESVRSFNSTLGVQGLEVSGEVSVFANWIDNYLYFAPSVVGDDVEIMTLVSGSYPVYRYTPTDVNFVGLEGIVRLWETEPWVTTFSASTVRAWSRDSEEHLVGIPGDSAVLKTGWSGEQFSITGSVEAMSRQHRVNPAQDFAPAPDGFVLMHLQTRYQHRQSEFHVQVRNLSNQQYRRYTSLLRYYADEPGRDIQFSFIQHW